MASSRRSAARSAGRAGSRRARRRPRWAARPARAAGSRGPVRTRRRSGGRGPGRLPAAAPASAGRARTPPASRPRSGVGRRTRRRRKRYGLGRRRRGRCGLGRRRRGSLRQPSFGLRARGLGGGDQVLGLVDRPSHPSQIALEVGHVLVQHPEVVPRRAGLLGERLLDLSPERALGVDVLLALPAARAPARRSPRAAGRTRRGRRRGRPRSPRSAPAAAPPSPRPRRRAGGRSRQQARSCAVGGPRAAPAADPPPPRSAGEGTSPTGSRTITAPSCRNVPPASWGASSAGTVKLIRHVPGAAPISDGGSGIAGNRWRPVSVSTTSIACPRISGRRRRHRPVTRTVTPRPPSDTSSTASIPRAEGRSLIGPDVTAASGRQ